MRVVREYSDRAISEESLNRILEAGRATGSSQNRQAWKFYMLRDKKLRAELAQAAYAAGNIESCQAVIAITGSGKGTFDAGRVAQNMILAAWSEGIGSSPNGVREAEAASRILGIAEDESVVTLLSFGYPAHPHQPRADDVEGILERINRKPLDELVVRVG